VLSGLFVNESLTFAERYHVMRMMFGGQVDPHDFHHVGFDHDILAVFLEEVGHPSGPNRFRHNLALESFPLSVVPACVAPSREGWLLTGLAGSDD
jgi:hypothetical protein